MPALKKKTQVEIAPIETEVIKFTVEGLTPLIVHKFSSKAIKMILDKQTKKAKSAKDAKVPFDEFVGSLHVIPGAKLPKKKLNAWESWPYKADTFGFPASGFKAAVANTSTVIENVTKKLVNGALYVIGDLVPLKYDKLVMREDHVVIGGMSKTADIRYRGAFEGWSAVLQVRFAKNLISADQVINLFNYAGFFCGVGEWRPGSRTAGPNGTFKVKTK
jgi:hypothetical protein